MHIIISARQAMRDATATHFLHISVLVSPNSRLLTSSLRQKAPVTQILNHRSEV